MNDIDTHVAAVLAKAERVSLARAYRDFYARSIADVVATGGELTAATIRDYVDAVDALAVAS